MLYKKILQKLTDNAFQAYLVGGCVRDQLLGRTPKDYDIATNARPEQVKELFPNAKFVGEQFGVSLVFEDGETVEVATFRSDGAYKDGRHPESVKFTDDIMEDLKRRDFTINAIAQDSSGEYSGVMYSLTDIDSKTIRAVGDPKERFQEDALRMLRAVRFTAQLCFRIESDTASAIQLLAANINKISKERVAQELNKILVGPYTEYALRRLERLNLADQIFSGITGWEEYYDEILLMFEDLEERDLTFALSALFLYMGKFATKRQMLGYTSYHKLAETSAGIAVRWMTEYKYSNSDIQSVKGVLEALGKTDELLQTEERVDKATWKRLMRSTNFESVIRLLKEDKLINGMGDISNAQYLKELYKKYKAEGLNPKLLINGDDIQNMGHTPGFMFKVLLEAIETEQLNGRLTSRETALNWAAVFAKAWRPV